MFSLTLFVVANLEQLESEHNKLLDTVKAQNLTPEEVARMNSDHETLSRNLVEHGAAAEEALDLYTNLLSSLGLFPPLSPPFEGVDLTLQLNLC